MRSRRQCELAFTVNPTPNQRWSRGHKAQGQGHKKISRPRTKLLEAKAKDTDASVLKKKKRQRCCPRGRPWPWPRSLKSLALALASKPKVLENSPVLGSRTALFFESSKFCWKTPETSRKISNLRTPFLFSSIGA